MSAGVAITGLMGCSSLDVSNPTIIVDETLNNATGATSLWSAARLDFSNAVTNAVLPSGMLTDEFLYDADPNSASTNRFLSLDLRMSNAYEALVTNNDPLYEGLQRTRTSASVAIPRLRLYEAAASRHAHLAEMFAVRGFAEVMLAEQFCPGFSLNEVVDFTPVYGGPLTTDSVFIRAVADFDSALVYATDSARVLNFARIGRARALLGLGRFAEAGVAAKDVPTGYTYTVIPAAYYELMSSVNGSFATADSYQGLASYSISNSEGGTGLDFVTANDPRLVVTPLKRAFFGDTLKTLAGLAKYVDQFVPVVAANDVEARLIEAEAQLQPASSPAGPWLATLNGLRATVGLPDTTDPGTAQGRVDLLFRERAFWLFATGHRLGDLRRLMSRYGRTSGSVFPTGSAEIGATYGTATSLVFPVAKEKQVNRQITGCTSR